MKWAVRVAEPLRTAISVCACGSKYIKTRKDQRTCLRCLKEAK